MCLGVCCGVGIVPICIFIAGVRLISCGSCAGAIPGCIVSAGKVGCDSCAFRGVNTFFLFFCSLAAVWKQWFVGWSAAAKENWATQCGLTYPCKALFTFFVFGSQSKEGLPNF